MKCSCHVEWCLGAFSFNDFPLLLLGVKQPFQAPHIWQSVIWGDGYRQGNKNKRPCGQCPTTLSWALNFALLSTTPRTFFRWISIQTHQSGAGDPWRATTEGTIETSPGASVAIARSQAMQLLIWDWKAGVVHAQWAKQGVLWAVTGKRNNYMHIYI